MTVAPSMTPKTSMTGVLFACVGAAALISVLQLVEMPGSGGWRATVAGPAPIGAPDQTRGTNALFAGATLHEGDISTARGRN
jgi:hypothetical protein